MIREIYSRFDREGLGFARIIVEPLVFAIPILFVWRVVRLAATRCPHRSAVPALYAIIRNAACRDLRYYDYDLGRTPLIQHSLSQS
jgi:hypothetical protein